MSSFTYRKNELHCESVAIKTIAETVSTPCYIYSHETLVDNYHKVADAFRAISPLICFAMKSNDNLSVVKALANEGAGCDIVSGGELKKALSLNIAPERIVFASVGKTEDEIRMAIIAGILYFNVESLPELEEINRIAAEMKKKARVALRINPDVAAATHARITTGTLKNKFGIDLTTARAIFRSQKKYSSVAITGIHMHIGSQIITSMPFVRALRKVTAFIETLKKDGVVLEYLDIGGGLGIIYKDEKPESATEFAAALMPHLKKTGLKIIMEPGRFIAGNAGIFVTKVLYLKNNGVKNFIIVDGGMNDFMRPSLYDAYHEIIPATKKTAQKTLIADVVGPICESGDFFAKERRLPLVHKGDLLAIMNAGAYGYVMSSNYNVRGRGAEVMVKGTEFAVVKRRETFEDLTRGETVASFLQ